MHGNYYKEMLNRGFLTLEEDETQYKYNQSSPFVMVGRQQTTPRGGTNSRDYVQEHFEDIGVSTIPITTHNFFIHPSIPRIHQQQHFERDISEMVPHDSSSSTSIPTYLSSYQQQSDIGQISAGKFTTCASSNHFPSLFSANQGAHSFFGGSVDRDSREYPCRNPYLDQENGEKIENFVYKMVHSGKEWGTPCRKPS